MRSDGMEHLAAKAGKRDARMPVQDSLPIDVPRYVRPKKARMQAVVPDVGIGDLVADFHRAFRLPSNSEPTLDIAPEIAALRLRLLAEEYRELEEAVDDGNLTAIADALGDLTYVIFGTAVTYGIDLEAIVREVHRSNMSKLDRSGRPLLRDDGKVLKSDRYEPPQIDLVLALQPPLF